MSENLKSELIAVGVDYDSALDRFMGKEALYQKFLIKFLDDKNFANLEECMNAKDAKEAFKCAHTIKGLSGNLGLNNLSDAIVPLVETLRKENLEGTDEMFEELKKVYTAICNVICKYK